MEKRVFQWRIGSSKMERQLKYEKGCKGREIKFSIQVSSKFHIKQLSYPG